MATVNPPLPQILPAVDDLRAVGVPIGAVQLDSWFYPHRTIRPFDTDAWDVPPTGLERWQARADILPEPYLTEVGRLQDAVPPVPVEGIERVLEEELGTSISSAFTSFDREPLASASLGQVHRATVGEEEVAVKVITLIGSDPEGVERLRARFHREARAAAALPHHPNIVPVYDYGTDEALGLDYIVMELLRGNDLLYMLEVGISLGIQASPEALVEKYLTTLGAR